MPLVCLILVHPLFAPSLPCLSSQDLSGAAPAREIEHLRVRHADEQGRRGKGGAGVTVRLARSKGVGRPGTFDSCGRRRCLLLEIRDPSIGCKRLLLLPGRAGKVLVANAVLAGAFVNFLRLREAYEHAQSSNPQ